MKRSRWGKAWVLAAGLSVLANGAACGQRTQPDPSQIVVIRENGKPDRRCMILQSYSTPDGKVIHYVRDIATGEPLRVLDSRPHYNNSGPAIGTIAPRPSDAGMLQALAGSPFANNNTHDATPAALAGSRMQPPTPGIRQASATNAPTESESSIQIQLKLLKSGSSPADRENAAMALAGSNAHVRPEVVNAVQESAKSDPIADVRTCCIICLYRMSPENPEVIPVIKSLQADPSEEVAQTARKAMQEIGKRDSSQPNR